MASPFFRVIRFNVCDPGMQPGALNLQSFLPCSCILEQPRNFCRLLRSQDFKSLLGHSETCAVLFNYCLPWKKSDTMCRVAVCVKRAIWLLVIYGILYVLIMPIPELGAAFSAKSTIATFALITYALLAFCFLLLSVLSRTLDSGLLSASDVLERFCIRLC